MEPSEERLRSIQPIQIWQPRWKDRVVLIAAYKIGTHNIIEFTKTPSMPGKYYVAGSEVAKCPFDTNGRIKCYAIPLDKLRKLAM